MLIAARQQGRREEGGGEAKNGTNFDRSIETDQQVVALYVSVYDGGGSGMKMLQAVQHVLIG